MILLGPCLTTILPAAFASAPDLAPTRDPGFVLSRSASTSVAAEDPPPDLGLWKGSVSLGATAANGNTDRRAFSATGKGEKRREKDRTTFDLLWNYAEEADGVTQRRTFGSAKYDYFVDEKRYYLAQTSAENDFNAQLELRWIVGLGVGRQFREDEEWKISGEAGLAWVDENFEGNADDGEYLAARLAYKADRKLSEKWEIGQAAEVFPSLEERDDVHARVDTHAKVTLSKNLFGQAQYLFTWDNTPAGGAEQADHLLLLNLGWSF